MDASDKTNWVVFFYKIKNLKKNPSYKQHICFKTSLSLHRNTGRNRRL